MKLGEIIDKFLEPPHPKGISIDGTLVTLSHWLRINLQMNFFYPMQ